MFAKASAALAVVLGGVPARAEVANQTGGAPARSLVGTGYWTVPTGVQTIYDPSTLIAKGWTTTYDADYADWTTLADLNSGTGDCVALAAKENPTDTTFLVMAIGRRTVIQNNVGVTENGAYFYTFTDASQIDTNKRYVNPGSAGFAPTSTVDLDPCDSTVGADTNQRLCWNIGQNWGGYRAGGTKSLNYNTDFQKIVMSGSCGDGTPCTNYPGGCGAGFAMQSTAKCLLSTCDRYDFNTCCKPTASTRGATNSNPSSLSAAQALARLSLGGQIPFTKKFNDAEQGEEQPATEGSRWRPAAAAGVLGLGLISAAAAAVAGAVTVRRRRGAAVRTMSTMSPEAAVESEGLLQE